MNWDSSYISDLIERALAEDIGPGDVTVEATIPGYAAGRARIVAKQELICAGLLLAERIFLRLDPNVKLERHVEDGQFVQKKQDVLRLDGRVSAILTGERPALNFLGRLSGIATLTHQFVQQLAGTQAKIRDTRKTTPGLRLLEQYAVRMGGGTNHRAGLYDAILLKRNHIALAGGVKAALDQAHSYASSRMSPLATTAYEAVGLAPSQNEASSLPIQIEVRNEDELREALGAGARAVLLDYFTPEQARACVQIVRHIQPDCVVEISGGVTLANARTYAETGADYLSPGVLTHSAPNADLSLLVDSLE
jgi:nicotinate-nucleotide pyrophosphorylase (carboxylating)